MGSREHWENIYSVKKPDEVSWYQPHPEVSLRMIRDSGIGRDAAIVDIGGGASTFVDDLLDAGFTNLTLLDISAKALAITQARLGERARLVRWIEGDILRARFEDAAFDLWHDRAVFHFLTDPADRKAYARLAARCVKPGGSLVMATFAEDGPAKCSGLPVKRYSAGRLLAELGPAWSLAAEEKEEHHTPAGGVQRFICCRFTQ